MPPTGQILHLLAADINKLRQVGVVLHALLANIIHLLGIIIVIIWMLGWVQALCTLLGLLLVAPFISWIQQKTLGLWQKKNKLAQERVEQVFDMLSNIKGIKINEWKEYFEKLLCVKREEELGFLNQVFFLDSFMFAGLSLTSYVLGIVFFLVGYMFDTSLTTSSAFTIISIIDLIATPLNQAPLAISRLLECYASIIRVQAFLYGKESDLIEPVQHTAIPPVILVNKATLEYTKGKPVLNDIILTMQPGEMVGIAGASGAGKSTLLAGILGTLHPVTGYINISGNIYCANQVR